MDVGLYLLGTSASLHGLAILQCAQRACHQTAATNRAGQSRLLAMQLSVLFAALLAITALVTRLLLKLPMRLGTHEVGCFAHPRASYASHYKAIANRSTCLVQHFKQPEIPATDSLAIVKRHTKYASVTPMDSFCPQIIKTTTALAPCTLLLSPVTDSPVGQLTKNRDSGVDLSSAPVSSASTLHPSRYFELLHTRKQRTGLKYTTAESLPRVTSYGRSNFVWVPTAKTADKSAAPLPWSSAKHPHIKTQQIQTVSAQQVPLGRLQGA